MKAIYIQQHRAVAGLTVSDIPAPSIKPGEVLVKVEASGINPSDAASVQGRFPVAVLPRIVGRDFAGRVVGILNELVPLFESGALKPPVIGERYPLSEAASAYGRVAAGGGGKVILIMTSGEG
jgi:NADPH:quinone reductase-like Zn-dependent oxidoreductase